MILVSNMLIEIIQIVSPAESIKIFLINLRHIGENMFECRLSWWIPRL